MVGPPSVFCRLTFGGRPRPLTYQAETIKIRTHNWVCKYINDPKDGTAQTRAELVELAEDFRRKANILYAFIRCVRGLVGFLGNEVCGGIDWGVWVDVGVTIRKHHPTLSADPHPPPPHQQVIHHPPNPTNNNDNRQSTRECKEGFCPQSDVADVAFDAETYVLGTYVG